MLGSLDDYICNKYKNNYYPSNGKCSKYRSIEIWQCYDYYFLNGYSSNKNYCYCNSNYILTNQNICILFLNGFRDNYCYYDNNENTAKCSSCYSGYTLNSNNICIYCGICCSSCYLDGNEPQCSSCSYGYIKDGIKYEKVEIPLNCNSYYNERFNNLNEAKWISCDSRYVLNNINNRCIQCPGHWKYCSLDNNNNWACQDCYNNYILNGNKLYETCSNNIEIGEEWFISCYIWK